MEKKLLTYIQTFKNKHGIQPGAKLIKQQARTYSNFPSKFKASKGWLEKFMRRHNLALSRSSMNIKMEAIQSKYAYKEPTRSSMMLERLDALDQEQQRSPGSVRSRRTEFQLSTD
jgi:Tc5 transposase DNA-binding domain